MCHSAFQQLVATVVEGGTGLQPPLVQTRLMPAAMRSSGICIKSCLRRLRSASNRWRASGDEPRERRGTMAAAHLQQATAAAQAVPAAAAAQPAPQSLAHLLSSLGRLPSRRRPRLLHLMPSCPQSGPQQGLHRWQDSCRHSRSRTRNQSRRRRISRRDPTTLMQ